MTSCFSVLIPNVHLILVENFVALVTQNISQSVWPLAFAAISVPQAAGTPVDKPHHQWTNPTTSALFPQCLSDNVCLLCESLSGFLSCTASSSKEFIMQFSFVEVVQ